MNELERWSTRILGDGETRPQLEMPLRIAGYDIDFAGVVNNAVYVRWLEDMRTAFMGRWLRFEDAVARGMIPMLVRTEIDYRAALRMGDRIVGRMWSPRVARASASIEAEIRRLGDGVVCAHSLQTVCFVDATTQRPIRLPSEFRGSLATPAG